MGYRVQTAERNFRRTGNHELPDAVVFDTVEDYVGFVGKKKEWKLFVQSLEKVRTSIPRLNDWVSVHCLWLTDARIDWMSILSVCHYFMDNPRPDLYLRQLPIVVHTKFMEEHAALIQSLLDFLIPDHIRNPQQRRLAERYFLRYDEPLIRMRILDAALACFGDLSDISLPLSDFERLDLQAKNILIAENKMNFLTLPLAPSTIAVWSGGARNPSEQLSLLDEEERKLFSQLKLTDKNRLEQEKITQGYVNEYLKNLLGSQTERLRTDY